MIGVDCSVTVHALYPVALLHGVMTKGGGGTVAQKPE